MLNDAARYDSYERSGPKVFIGEWAAREGEPTTNLYSALADAAFMAGMERNADVVEMSCYAPLLVNVNPGGMQWKSDLIGYDVQSSYGSPSYHAQKMFSNYLGNVSLPVHAEKVSTQSWQRPARKETPQELPPATQVPTMFFSATKSDQRGEIYLKVVNSIGSAQTVQVDLAGAARGGVRRQGDRAELGEEGRHQHHRRADQSGAGDEQGERAWQAVQLQLRAVFGDGAGAVDQIGRAYWPCRMYEGDCWLRHRTEPLRRLVPTIGGARQIVPRPHPRLIFCSTMWRRRTSARWLRWHRRHAQQVSAELFQPLFPPYSCCKNDLGHLRVALVLESIGAPDTVRTCDPCLRRAVLYPAELRAPKSPV